MKMPPNHIKLAKRLFRQSTKLFPDDKEQQDEWLIQQLLPQLKHTKQNEKLAYTLLATALQQATMDSYERFPDDKEQAVAHILELMEWDNTPETRNTASKALHLLVTDPLFAEEKEVRS
jgi:hypothetical protein